MFKSHIFFHCFGEKKCANHYCRETTTENNKFSITKIYTNHTWSEKGLNGTVVNWSCHSIPVGLLEIMLTFLIKATCEFLDY